MHAVAGAHGAQDAGAAAYVPTGHEAAVYAQEDSPAGLYAPAGHGVGPAEDSGQKEPATHKRQAAIDAPRYIGLYLPAAQGKQVKQSAGPLRASVVSL